MSDTEITYDFTMFEGDPIVYTLNDEFTELYEKYFPMLTLLFGETKLVTGAYRVKITGDEMKKTMSITRVYYY